MFGRSSRSNPMPRQASRRLSLHAVSRARYSNVKPENHALLIFGGRSGKLLDICIKPRSERTFYLDAANTYNRLQQNQTFKPENIRVLFGSGEANQETIIHNKYYQLLVKYFKEEQIIFKENNLFPIHGASSLENIIKEFDILAKRIQPKDRLFIFLEGHGTKYLGTVLYNTNFTIQILGPGLLKSLLKKTPRADIRVYIDSCFSGNYLGLSQNDVVVYTSTTINRVCFYSAGDKSANLDQFLEYFDNSKNALLEHVKGCLLVNNFYGGDSLSHFVNSKISSYLPPHVGFLVTVYQKNMLKLFGQRHSFFSLLHLKS